MEEGLWGCTQGKVGLGGGEAPGPRAHVGPHGWLEGCTRHCSRPRGCSPNGAAKGDARSGCSGARQEVGSPQFSQVWPQEKGGGAALGPRPGRRLWGL